MIKGWNGKFEKPLLGSNFLLAMDFEEFFTLYYTVMF